MHVISSLPVCVSAVLVEMYVGAYEGQRSMSGVFSLLLLTIIFDIEAFTE